MVNIYSEIGKLLFLIIYIYAITSGFRYQIAIFGIIIIIIRGAHCIIESFNESFKNKNPRVDSDHEKFCAVGPNVITVLAPNINAALYNNHTLLYNIEKEMYFVCIKIKDNNILIQPFNSKNNEVVQEAFDYIYENKDQCFQKYTGLSIQTIADSIDHQCIYMSAKKEIILHCETNLDINTGLFLSPKVEFLGNKMKFMPCYIDGNDVYIKTNAQESYYKSIRIVFDKNRNTPMGLRGGIDFINNETCIDNDFVVFGAKRIEIVFKSPTFY